MKIGFVFYLFITLLCFSCESERVKKERLAREEKQRIEFKQKQAEQEQAEALRLKMLRLEQEKREDAERIEREAQLEKKRKEQEIYDKYINNSLQTGGTPYFRYYGGNPTCDVYGCSQIEVITSNSDVLVTIKKDGGVIRHAFIQANDSYTFSVPNGVYQVFFYYGKGWNPKKEMKNGTIKGGFIENEQFAKDDPQSLNDNRLEYKLILQQDGNFNTIPSDQDEVL